MPLVELMTQAKDEWMFWLSLILLIIAISLLAYLG